MEAVRVHMHPQESTLRTCRKKSGIYNNKMGQTVMAKIRGCAFHGGMVYYEDEKGMVVPATFPDSPMRLFEA